MCDCHSEIFLGGNWLEDNPINEKVGELNFRGDFVEFYNMKMGKPKRWQVKNNQLKFISDSLGNGVNETDTLTYEIVRLDHTNLILKNDKRLWEFTRSRGTYFLDITDFFR